MNISGHGPIIVTANITAKEKHSWLVVSFDEFLYQFHLHRKHSFPVSIVILQEILCYLLVDKFGGVQLKFHRFIMGNISALGRQIQRPKTVISALLCFCNLRRWYKKYNVPGPRAMQLRA